MFETTVVECKRRRVRTRSAATFPISVGLHFLCIAGVLVANVWTVAFPSDAPAQTVLYSVVASPPPPPPPPPPPKAGARVIDPPKVIPIELQEMVPTMIPETVPEIDPPGGSPDIAPGEGVEGGIEGGVLGGVIGGVIGGEIGGILGGTEGGVLPPDPSGFFRAEYDVAKLSYTSQVFPVYPEDARIRGLEGIVIVDYVVGKNGKVREVRVLQDPHPMLTKAAVGAIKQWKVKPTIVNGEAVEVIHKLSIIFSLQ